MRTETIELLKDLNRKFYDEFASSFAASRAQTEPGLEQILQHVHAGDCVLDLGCGQGRIALLLPQGCSYVGMDFSEEMIALARQHAVEAEAEVRFVVDDLLAPHWSELMGTYDWIFLRAVLHHVPSLDKRRAILRQASQYLKPQGKIVLANWQFMNIARLRRRVLDWSLIGLSSNDVEMGDYLLDWQRDGYGLRYVHLVDEAETKHLANTTNLQIETLYRADGHSNDLTLYAILIPQ